MSFTKFKGLYLTLILALLILFLSLKPLNEGDTKPLVSDKLLHLIAYGAMVLPVSLERIFPHFSVFLFALAYGGCIELIQPFTGREADIMDFLANAAGIILGILVARSLTLIFKVKP
jgi:glycopeptide antibiotics resistance protein